MLLTIISHLRLFHKKKRITESLAGHYISSSDSKWHAKATHIVVPTNYNGYTTKVFYGIGEHVRVHVVT